jgi:hypothetical protein
MITHRRDDTPELWQALAYTRFLGEMVMEGDKVEKDEEGEVKGYSGKKLAVFFPDTGAAVMVEQDWQIGKVGKCKVPLSVRCASFPNDFVDANDAVSGRGGLGSPGRHPELLQRVMHVCDRNSPPAPTSSCFGTACTCSERAAPPLFVY